MNKKLLFIISEIELKYFEFNPLVTDFWLIKEFLERGYEVFVSAPNSLYIKKTIPYTKASLTRVEDNNIFYDKNSLEISLNDFDVIFLRPDPPVDIDYINLCYILNYVDKNKTQILNSPNAILEKNEKLYVNEFENIAPQNIVTSDIDEIKKFLKEKNEIIIKPLNRCFSSGVFYLKQGDKNTNTIIKTATNDGKTLVMVQEFLPKVSEGDKRVIFIAGEILDWTVQKVGVDDFKFNTHTDENFKIAKLTEKEKEVCSSMSKKLLDDGISMAGLDVIDGKVIEINITSPCFFIKEINAFHNINLEKIIVDRLENFINNNKNQKLNVY